jgi:uncharacterized membrane protein
MWGFSLWALSRLPARVPMHWNVRGEVDGWGGPLEASLLLPGLATGVYLLILVFDWGRLDFKAARAMSPATTRQIRLLVILLLAGIHGSILWTTLRGEVMSASRINLFMSLFFILLGNLMPRLEPNAWAGIRIPPTLENREVWKRTHRVAGRWMLAAGLLGLPCSLLPEWLATPAVLALMILPLVGAVIYAYWVRHKLNGGGTHVSEAP